LIKIGPGDPDASLPYANLLPLVETLLAHGNSLAFDGDPFLLTRDGWCCQLRHPIDFALVEATFVLPATIICPRRHDGIVDVLTRSFIRGPGWRGSSFVYPESSSERREERLLALARLPEPDHYLMFQRYFKYASVEELAAKTGLSRNAVATRLWQIRKSLRAL
jgi:hypothetical protein